MASAFAKQEINSVSSVPPALVASFTNDKTSIYKIGFPRIFAVFMNPKADSIFKNTNVRKAINFATNKDAIIQNALLNYAYKIDSPVPKEFTLKESNNSPYTYDLEQSESLMKKAGFKKEDGLWTDKSGNKASFTLSVPSVQEFKDVAAILSEQWRKAGFAVKIKTYDLSTFTQKIIRERDYDAILFGEAPGRALDLYAFWHSSQKDDPGLNIAMYINKKADKILENLRKEQDINKRKVLLSDFEKIINEDAPALFLYSPNFIYILPKDLKGFDVQLISYPHERFTNIHKWYFNTQRVWDIKN